MSILARFTATPSVTTEQYDESVRRLEGSEAKLATGRHGVPRRLHLG